MNEYSKQKYYIHSRIPLDFLSQGTNRLAVQNSGNKDATKHGSILPREAQ